MRNKEESLEKISRSERKALERSKNKEEIEEDKKRETRNTRQEKYALIEEQNEVKEILKTNETLKDSPNDIEEKQDKIEDDLQVGELGKTQHLLNLTSEITAVLSDNIEENLFSEEKKESSFNPITWIGLLIILCFGYFIYLVIRSGYDEELLLLIDSGMLLGITLVFGISIISNKKWTKIFSILNLLVILSFIGINIFLLYDWNNTKEKKKEDNPIPEKVVQKKLSCEKDNLKINVLSKDNYITSIERIQTFTTDEEKTAIIEKFKEQDGLSSKVDENEITITFNFQTLDTNQYKNIMRDYLEYYRESSDFLYVKDDKLDYTIYKETELKEFICNEKEES